METILFDFFIYQMSFLCCSGTYLASNVRRCGLVVRQEAARGFRGFGRASLELIAGRPRRNTFKFHWIRSSSKSHRERREESRAERSPA